MVGNGGLGASLNGIREKEYFCKMSKIQLKINDSNKIHLVCQVVEVPRVLRWLFVCLMTPGAVIHPLAPD